jgi:TorA maturation chaperone TorD
MAAEINLPTPKSGIDAALVQIAASCAGIRRRFPAQSVEKTRHGGEPRSGNIMTRLLQFDVARSERQSLSAVFDLLAVCWSRELERDELGNLAESELAPFWRALGGWLPPSAASVDADLIEALAVDYCQLLVGPRDQIPPVQSVWAAGSYGSDPSQSMQTFIDALPGFTPCSTIVDHFAVQLQFAARLFSHSREDLDETSRRHFDELANRFFQRHLQWPERFVQLIATEAETPFYQGLAAVTGKLLFSQHADD